MKKNWITIKRGLSEDPKHRERMGNRVWLFLHLIDRADWETGKVYDWRDEEEAEDMVMNWRTLQRQRQELADLGYISCKSNGRGQEITIYNWTNPRNYSGKTINPRGGQDTGSEPEQDEKDAEYVEYADLRNQSTHESTHESTHTLRRDLRTTTYDSEVRSQQSEAAATQANTPETGIADLAKAYESNIGMITAMIAETLQDDMAEYGVEWCKDAIKEAVTSNVRSWKYCQSILARWKREGKGSLRQKRQPRKPEYTQAPADPDAAPVKPVFVRKEPKFHV